MAGKKVIDKQFKLDAVQYRKDHPELTFEQVAKNLGISNSSIHRWCKQFSDTKGKNESKDENRDLFRGSGVKPQIQHTSQPQVILTINLLFFITDCTLFNLFNYEYYKKMHLLQYISTIIFFCINCFYGVGNL